MKKIYIYFLQFVHIAIYLCNPDNTTKMRLVSGKYFNENIYGHHYRANTFVHNLYLHKETMSIMPAPQSLLSLFNKNMFILIHYNHLYFLSCFVIYSLNLTSLYTSSRIVQIVKTSGGELSEFYTFYISGIFKTYLSFRFTNVEFGETVE